MSQTETTERQADYQYVGTGGKMVYGYRIDRIEAPTYTDALQEIPGDFKVVWHSSNTDNHVVDVVRTF